MIIRNKTDIFIFHHWLVREHTISTLLCGNIVDAAKSNIKQILTLKRRKEYFAETGISGVENICTSVAIFGFQLIIPWFLVRYGNINNLCCI